MTASDVRRDICSARNAQALPEHMRAGSFMVGIDKRKPIAGLREEGKTT